MQSKHHEISIMINQYILIRKTEEISFITNNEIIIKKNEIDEQFLWQANGVYIPMLLNLSNVLKLKAIHNKESINLTS